MLQSGAVGGVPMPRGRKPVVNGSPEWWAPLACARCGEMKQAGQFAWQPTSHQTRRMSICRECFGLAISVGIKSRKEQRPVEQLKQMPSCHSKEHMDLMRQRSIESRRAKKAEREAAKLTELVNSGSVKFAYAGPAPQPSLWDRICAWWRG